MHVPKANVTSLLSAMSLRKGLWEVTSTMRKPDNCKLLQRRSCHCWLFLMPPP